MFRPSQSVAIFIAVVVFLIGIFLVNISEWVFSERIDGQRVLMVLQGLRFLAIAIAIVLVIRRPVIDPVNILISSIVSLAGLGMLFLLAEIFITLPPIQSGWLTLTPDDTLNELGHRGQPFNYDPSDYVVVLIGDSQVEAHSCCAVNQMPEQILADQLSSQLDRNVRVFSIGAGGYGQDQMLLQLQSYFDQGYRVDLVVHWLTLSNDVWNNVFRSHYPTDGQPKPTFWIENDTLQGPTEHIGDSVDVSVPRLVELIRRVTLPERFPENIDQQWADNYLPAPYHLDDPVRYGFDGDVSDEWQQQWDKGGRFRNENFLSDKNHSSIQFVPRSPRMDYGIRLTNFLLLELQQLSQSNGADFITFFADRSGNDDTPDMTLQSLDGRLYLLSKQQLNDNLQDLTSGISVFGIPVLAENPTVSETDGHLNYESNVQVLSELAIIIDKWLDD
jgi:hypothetical protein